MFYCIPVQVSNCITAIPLTVNYKRTAIKNGFFIYNPIGKAGFFRTCAPMVGAKTIVFVTGQKL